METIFNIYILMGIISGLHFLYHVPNAYLLSIFVLLLNPLYIAYWISCGINNNT